jgi:hypothetical protein
MQEATVPTTITIDGTEYPVADFSVNVQRLVEIHAEWRNELATERLAVAKTEAAIRSLDAELTQAVAAELKAKTEATAATAATAAEEVPAADAPAA